jgi:CHRD domain
MKRLSLFAAALAFVAAGCSSSTTPSTTTPTKPTFTADLRPSNETTAVVGPETSGTAQATITFDNTKDTAGNITAATATFVVNMTGFPAGTTLTGAHIHPGVAGVAGGVVVSTAIAANEVVVGANGTGSFTKAGIVVDAALAQTIQNNPAGYYFNIHTATNAGGVARGQLVKVQ